LLGILHRFALGNHPKVVKQIRAQIEGTKSDYDREKLQERLAKLVGGVAVIRFGAYTETEMKDKKGTRRGRSARVPRGRSPKCLCGKMRRTFWMEPKVVSSTVTPSWTPWRAPSASWWRSQTGQRRRWQGRLDHRSGRG